MVEDDDPAFAAGLGGEDAAGALETVRPRHWDVHEDSAWLWHRQDR